MSLVARLRLGVGIILCLLHTAPMAGPLPGEALFAVALKPATVWSPSQTIGLARHWAA